MRKINDGLTNAQRYKLRHPDKVLETRRKCSLAHDYIQRNKDSRRRSAFGQDAVVYYDHTLIEQNKRCAICDKEFIKTPSQDHDHACCPNYRTCGKCKRGLVCHYCNTGLAYMERPEWVEAAVAYLSKWNKKLKETQKCQAAQNTWYASNQTSLTPMASGK